MPKILKKLIKNTTSINETEGMSQKGQYNIISNNKIDRFFNYIINNKEEFPAEFSKVDFNEIYDLLKKYEMLYTKDSLQCITGDNLEKIKIIDYAIALIVRDKLQYITNKDSKMRNLGIPTVTDRIIQQAIFQVISPIFEKQFNDNSSGFRPNMSCEQAVIRALRQLGVSHEIAFNCANTRKGYYQICKSRYVQFAINNERLRKRGLVFLLEQYEKVHI